MYTYSYNAINLAPRSTNSAAAVAVIASTMITWLIFFLIIALGLTVLILIARWKLFKKANVDGWEALIPVHSDIVEMKLGGMHTGLWFINLIVLLGIGPIVFAFWKNILLAKAFGKGAGFGVLLTFFPFVCYPILAFGKSQYIGASEQETV